MWAAYDSDGRIGSIFRAEHGIFKKDSFIKESLLYLHAMLRNGIIKVVSLVLAIWYLLCVLGFNVHFCNVSGESVVESLVSGPVQGDVHRGCPHDMQPGHHDRELSGKACCTDNIKVLSLTGREEDDNDGCGPVCGHFLAYVTIDGIYHQDASAVLLRRAQDCSIIPDIPDNIFSLFSVWRI